MNFGGGKDEAFRGVRSLEDIRAGRLGGRRAKIESIEEFKSGEGRGGDALNSDDSCIGTLSAS